MKMNTRIWFRITLLVSLTVLLTTLSTRHHADTGTCGGATSTVPFTDVMGSIFFCNIAEAYFSALTNGTSATTYSPSAGVTRDQMAAFITRTQDSALRRGNEGAALQQFWTTTPNYASVFGGLGTTTVGTSPRFVQSDGEDLWVANSNNTLSRVRGSDGKLLDTWTGATAAFGVLAAMGRVFVTGDNSPGSLYMIDPTQPAGAVTEVTNNGLGAQPLGIAFDGSRIWTANFAGSVSIVTPGMTTPWSVATRTTGFSSLKGILFDGSNIWVADLTANTLLKLDQNGAIVQTVMLGNSPQLPAFDGTNIWVPNRLDNSVSVVRAATGTVIATLTGNGLNSPNQAAFDGQRILVTNSGGNSVSLWKAADLTPIGNGFSTLPSIGVFGACSDGTYFWITMSGANQLARF